MKITFVVLFAPALYIFSQIAFAQKEREVNPKGEVTFKIKNAGMDVTGTIDITDLQIVFDEKNPGRSQVIATADPNKINTGIKIRDNHLRRADYFDVVHYPTIKIQSRAFKKDGGNFEGHFDLTIKNFTKGVVVHFTRKEKNNTVVYKGSFVMGRSDFHLGEDSAILGELVTVNFSVSCEKWAQPTMLR